MPSRAKLIQLVHVGASHLFADEDARRDWQRDRTGHTSCSSMTNADLENLVAELRRKGALNKRPPRRAGRVPFNRSTYMDKIEAQLASMGLSWQYAEAIAWRVTGGKGGKPTHVIQGGKIVREPSNPGVKRLEWVKKAEHFKAIIAALHVEQEKRGHMARINEYLKRLGKDITYIDTLVPEHMQGIKWQRNRDWLNTINEHLGNQVQEQEENND